MGTQDTEAAAPALILDTNIIVWVLRAHSPAVSFVDRIPLMDRNVSAVSYLELLRGCQNKSDYERTRLLLEEEFAEIVPLSNMASRLAIGLMEKCALSRKPGIPDLLIAATALTRGEPLATANVKDFNFIPGLQLKPFYP